MLLAGVAFTGCDKIKDLTNITKELEYGAAIEVPGVPGLPDTVTKLPPGGVSGDFPTFKEATNSEQTMKEYNTNADLVTSVNLTKLNLTMNAPEGQTFDYVDTLRVYITATGMSEKLLGYKYGIPKGQKSVDLDREDVNIKEYFLKDSIGFRVNGHFVEVPLDGANMELKSTFTLLANPLN